MLPWGALRDRHLIPSVICLWLLPNLLIGNSQIVCQYYSQGAQTRSFNSGIIYLRNAELENVNGLSPNQINTNWHLIN